MISILIPMVDLHGSTAVDWFCILSYFRLDTLWHWVLDDRRREKERVHLIHAMVLLYMVFFFSDILSARRLRG